MTRNWLFWVGLLLCFGVPNALVFRTRARLAAGRTVYLRLDCKSMYHSPSDSQLYLVYSLELPTYGCNWPSPGNLTAEVDSQGKILSWTPDSLPPTPTPSPLPLRGHSQIRLPYKVSGGHLSVAPSTLRYKASLDLSKQTDLYAVLRLLDDGQLVVVGLADQKLAPL